MLSARIPHAFRITTSAAMSSVAAEFKDPIKEQADRLVARKPTESNRGKVQSWLKPVYTAPHQYVFEQSPDFSFKDGRTVHVTSQRQLEYKLDQIRLAKKMVALLSETEQVGKVYETSIQETERRQAEQLGKRPVAKGNRTISD